MYSVDLFTFTMDSNASGVLVEW